MHDNVVSMLATGFQSKSISTLRFNFRGVGSSEGDYSGGNGEAEDVQAAIDWCRDSHPGAGYFLCGYSFGAMMALAVLGRSNTDSKLRGSILVAPPVQMLPAAADSGWNIRQALLIILGSQDSIVSQDSVIELFGSKQVKILAGADHFFHGQQSNMLTFTQEFVDGT